MTAPACEAVNKTAVPHCRTWILTSANRDYSKILFDYISAFERPLRKNLLSLVPIHSSRNIQEKPLTME